MTNTAKLFELGQLAEASYADFDGVTPSSSAGVVVGRLISGKSEFSNIQAKEFSLHWQVVSHQPDTISGFSATLFKRLDVNQIVDLYNDRFRLNTATTAHCTQSELDSASTPPANGYIYSYQVANDEKWRAVACWD